MTTSQINTVLLRAHYAVLSYYNYVYYCLLTICFYPLAVSPPGENCDSFSRGQHRQAMLKRVHRNDNKRFHTAGIVDDIKVSKKYLVLKVSNFNLGNIL